MSIVKASETRAGVYSSVLSWTPGPVDKGSHPLCVRAVNADGYNYITNNIVYNIFNDYVPFTFKRP